VPPVSTQGNGTLRRRILTDHERKLIRKYLEADGERGATVRSIARYAKENLKQLRIDLELAERFYQAYTKRNSEK
jgi:hypothetical protein